MKNPHRLSKMNAKQLVRVAKTEFNVNLPEQAGRETLVECVLQLHDYLKDRPKLPNKLLEIDLRSRLNARISDFIIRQLNRKHEPHPDEKPIIGLKAIGKCLGWKYEYTRKHSKELEDAKVIYWDKVDYKGQYRWMHCAYPFDLKNFIKKMRTKPQAVFRNRRLP